MEKAMRKRTDFIADGGFWLLHLSRMLSSLYICLGRYGDRMNIGPAPHEAQCVVTIIEDMQGNTFQ